VRSGPMQAVGIALLALCGAPFVAAQDVIWDTPTVGGVTPTEAEKAAFANSFEGNCESVEDFLDYQGRPILLSRTLRRERFLLQWAKEQGMSGLPDEVTLTQRFQTLYPIYTMVKEKVLPDVVLADQAPDVGVKVVVGEPRVVMWAPEGDAADVAGERVRLKHLGGTLAGQGRWGQYMFPQISRLRGGMLVIQLYVGGDSSHGREYLYYVSDDQGRNWRHFTVYNDVEERPANEIVLRLPDGEELRGPLERDYKPIDVAGLNLKTYAGRVRLGDLPKEQQGVPIYSRKPGQNEWTRETATWDPDLLVGGAIPSPILTSESNVMHLPDGSMVTAVWREPVMSDVRPDGTVIPEGENHQIWRSYDRGRTWKWAGIIPRLRWWPFLQEETTRRPHLVAFPDGSWVAAYRHDGPFCSGGGPLIITKSTDEGKTWSKPRAIRMPGVNPLGLMLANGIGVFTYQRPGIFLTFCGDGTGDAWGNDVTLVKPWRWQRHENSCCNGSFVATGPDRFIYAYSKWDVPDPWGQPRQAVIAQEFIVSKK